MSKDPTCEKRVDAALERKIEAFTAMLEAERDDYGPLNEYGLSFDYVAPGTFSDQPEAFFRYQISWGGPSDEFRFFTNPDYSLHRIEYWFLDWFDGAHRVLSGSDYELLEQIWGYLTCEDQSYLEGLVKRQPRKLINKQGAGHHTRPRKD